MWGKRCSFPHKTLWIAKVFHCMIFFQFLLFFLFFCNIFFKIIFIDFIFLILNWLEFNFVTNFNHVGESTVTFLIKHCGLLQCLSTYVFFLMIFSKLSLSILFF